MFFLIKAAFWLCLVALLLPVGGERPAKEAPARVRIEPQPAQAAPAPSAGDLTQACAREREICAWGSAALFAAAQDNAAGLYQTLVGWVWGPDPAQGTLRPSDMKPAWRAPAPARSL